MASTTWGEAWRAGPPCMVVRATWRMGLRHSPILDSPLTQLPSAKVACSTSGSGAAGRIRPLTCIQADSSASASEMEPRISFSAAMSRLPMACPDRKASSVSKRYWNSSSISGSRSASAQMQLRMSPGGTTSM